MSVHLTSRRDQGGVSLSPFPLRAGETVTVYYNGLLADSGAHEVTLHMGHGDQWSGSRDIKMQQTAKGWESTISLDRSEKLNFCFRDNAGNWDNNNGVNWSHEILNPQFT